MKKIKLGKIYCKDNIPYVKGADVRLTWGMDEYLAAILRDYIRMFEKEDYGIGWAVLGEDWDMDEDGTEEENEELKRKWHALLLETADMFDEYLKAAANIDTDFDYKAHLDKAFDNLKKIFMDLWT